MATRNEIANALLTLVNSTQMFKLASRRIQTHDQVPASSRPCVFLVEPKENHMQAEQYTPTKRIFDYELWIYANADDKNIPASSVLNDILDALDASSGGVLRPDDPANNALTLGGKVKRCWIEGEVIKEPGDLDGWARMLIPLKALIP